MDRCIIVVCFNIFDTLDMMRFDCDVVFVSVCP